jgi:hypothetical protein
VQPLLSSLVEAGVGEAEGGVAFCAVEYDAPDVMAASTGIGGGLGMAYMITSIPTLLAFDDRGEPRTDTKVTDGRQLTDRRFLEEWIRNEARRNGGGGGGGGGSGTGILGGLFGSWR